MGIGIRGYTEGTIQNPSAFKEKNREIERIVHRLGGIKWLYSRNYYNENEFWSVYPRAEYDALRVKYNAQYLASVYDKIRVSERPMEAPHPRGWNRVFARTSVLAMKHGG